jgi:hypothetical protein
MLRASLGKVVHTVKRAGTYAAKVPPQELHKTAVHVRAVVDISRVPSQNVQDRRKCEDDFQKKTTFVECFSVYRHFSVQHIKTA